MNYRHAFHAGNSADVFKHAILARLLTHLRAKPKPFRVIDTHAGAGRYDVSGPQAQRTGEWREGIGRLYRRTLNPKAQALLAPFLGIVEALNPDGELRFYPGSPLIVRELMRDGDRLSAFEREPDAARALIALLRHDRRVGAHAADGWAALNAGVPPPERRGLVLIDPPYEHPDEIEAVWSNLAGAHRKWPTGIYAVWYPIKAASEAIPPALRRLGLARTLVAQLHLRPRPDGRLAASAMAIVNPPWRLHVVLTILLPELGAALGGARGGAQLHWLDAGEPAVPREPLARTDRH